MAWDRLREDMTFKAMKEKLIQHRSTVSWRQTLSAHMTQSCGVGHKAPIPSLKSCGFNSLNINSGLYQLDIDFPHAFDESDDMAFSYSSALHASETKAQESAACEIMVAMVVAAPRSFRMVPSCFKGGAADIEEIRSFAESLDIVDPQHWQDACGAMWSQRATPLMEYPMPPLAEILESGLSGPAIKAEYDELVELTFKGWLQRTFDFVFGESWPRQDGEKVETLKAFYLQEDDYRNTVPLPLAELDHMAQIISLAEQLPNMRNPCGLVFLATEYMSDADLLLNLVLIRIHSWRPYVWNTDHCITEGKHRFAWLQEQIVRTRNSILAARLAAGRRIDEQPATVPGEDDILSEDEEAEDSS